MQLELDLERGDRDEQQELQRRQRNRDELYFHLRGGGVVGALQIELVVHAANHAAIRIQEGLRRLVVRLSERAAAGMFGASKSGVHEALRALASRGLVTTFRGGYVVEWDRVVELEPADPLAGIPPPAQTVGRWSVDGRSMVGPLEYQEQENTPSHPSNPNPSAKNSKGPTADRPSRRAGRLPFVLRWRHLFGEQNQPRREGIVRLHLAAVQCGWYGDEDRLADFTRTLGLVLWLPTSDRRDSGVEHPLSWLIAALRDGQQALMSWPADSYFDRAAYLVSSAEGLDEQLQIDRAPERREKELSR